MRLPSRRSRLDFLSLCLVLALFLCGESCNAAQVIAQGQPAFPGAQGFGANTPGGRGGQVLLVTNLEDYDPGGGEIVPGSLRAALTTTGPRTVLFRVAGIIDLAAPLHVEEPFLTVAGQSAPGGGICLRGYGTVIRDTHDVVLRHLRFRPGDRIGVEQAKVGRAWETDALSVVGSENVMIDHCSASWANDEVLSITRCNNVTVQWSLITESLNRSTHAKGQHGYGGLIAYIEDGRVSQHHNLWAYHSNRSPRPGSTENCKGPGLLFDFRNNVIHRGGRGYTVANFDKVRMNYVGNSITAGRVFSVTPGVRMYLGENLLNGQDKGWEMISGRCVREATPFPVAPVDTQSTAVARAEVLASAGAILPIRDTVDARIVAQVRAGSRGLIDTQDQVGGWPDLPSAEPSLDSDFDGMPDEWEHAHGFDMSHRDASALDADGDGYTDLEEFLNGTNPRVVD